MNQTMDRSLSKGSEDPAADAAAMLLRLGFAIFALVVPSATLMSRWVIVVLVPIGAILIIFSALLRGDSERLFRRLGGSFATLPGILALALMVWAMLSLTWTPFPADAAERLFKTLGAAALGLLAAFSLPGRMRASNLHLVSIGVALGALLILAATIFEKAGSSILVFPAATPGRVSVLLAVLVWAATAWLLIKNRRLFAALLVAVVAAAIWFGPAREAVGPLLIGLAVFGLAWRRPEQIGAYLAGLVVIVILATPLLALAAKYAVQAFSLEHGHIIARIGLWWDLAMADPLHLMTGRGYDAAVTARLAGRIPEAAPIGLLADVWFDLGLLGALALAGLMATAFLAASRLGFELAPASLAGIAAAFAFAVMERGATQTWWLNGLAVMGIVLTAVGHGRYRTVRPRALLKAHGERRATMPEPA